jgi:hypothetical protein
MAIFWNGTEDYTGKIVNDNFFVIENVKSLKGCPKIVNGIFDCSRCYNLINLEGAPEVVSGSFKCSDCSNLRTLEGSPKFVGDDFDCGGCFNLKSLKGCPDEISGIFILSFCESLEIIDCIPDKFKSINLFGTKIKKIEKNVILELCKNKKNIDKIQDLAPELLSEIRKKCNLYELIFDQNKENLIYKIDKIFFKK